MFTGSSIHWRIIPIGRGRLEQDSSLGPCHRTEISLLARRPFAPRVSEEFLGLLLSNPRHRTDAGLSPPVSASPYSFFQLDSRIASYCNSTVPSSRINSSVSIFLTFFSCSLCLCIEINEQQAALRSLQRLEMYIFPRRVRYCDTMDCGRVSVRTFINVY